MKVLDQAKWYFSHTSLSVYLVSRLYQLLDTSEVISYRYSVTNGLILVEELYDIAVLCLEGFKSHQRLDSLLHECVDKDIKSSVKNDVIIKKYFPEVINEMYAFLQLDLSKVEDIKTIKIKTEYHLLRMRNEYLKFLKQEFESIDFSADNKEFDITTNNISNLLEILVAQGLHSGHSIGFIAVSCEGLVEDKPTTLINQLFKIFSFDEDRLFKCFTLAEFEPILNILGANFSLQQEQGQFREWEIPVSLEGHTFEVFGKDAYSALRDSVVKAFRKLALKQPGIDQNQLKPFWEESHYFNASTKKYIKYRFNNFSDDPMISSVRKNTLNKSLEPYKSLEEFPDEILEKFEESLYFYHLAHSAPSVENSYLLLWTSLEAIMGIRGNDSSNIAIVKDNVSQTLALGAVGRRVNGIVQRLKINRQKFGWKYYGPSVSDVDNTINEFQELGLCHWLAWLADPNIKATDNDLFEDFRREPLLCRQYTTINNSNSDTSWKTLKQIRQATTRSEKNTRYQLDRLYLTRNKIVHAGKFGRTGIYLWGHLEWYIGKILAVSLLILNNSPKEIYENNEPRDVIFSSTTLQYKTTCEYLTRHHSNPITVDNIYDSGVMKFPVLCF